MPKKLSIQQQQKAFRILLGIPMDQTTQQIKFVKAGLDLIAAMHTKKNTLKNQQTINNYLQEITPIVEKLTKSANDLSLEKITIHLEIITLRLAFIHALDQANQNACLKARLRSKAKEKYEDFQNIPFYEKIDQQLQEILATLTRLKSYYMQLPTNSTCKTNLAKIQRKYAEIYDKVCTNDWNHYTALDHLLHYHRLHKYKAWPDGVVDSSIIALDQLNWTYLFRNAQDKLTKLSSLLSQTTKKLEKEEWQEAIAQQQQHLQQEQECYEKSPVLKGAGRDILPTTIGSFSKSQSKSKEQMTAETAPLPLTASQDIVSIMTTVSKEQAKSPKRQVSPLTTSSAVPETALRATTPKRKDCLTDSGSSQEKRLKRCVLFSHAKALKAKEPSLDALVSDFMQKIYPDATIQLILAAIRILTNICMYEDRIFTNKFKSSAAYFFLIIADYYSNLLAEPSENQSAIMEVTINLYQHSLKLCFNSKVQKTLDLLIKWYNPKKGQVCLKDDTIVNDEIQLAVVLLRVFYEISGFTDPEEFPDHLIGVIHHTIATMKKYRAVKIIDNDLADKEFIMSHRLSETIISDSISCRI